MSEQSSRVSDVASGRACEVCESKNDLGDYLEHGVLCIACASKLWVPCDVCGFRETIDVGRTNVCYNSGYPLAGKIVHSGDGCVWGVPEEQPTGGNSRTEEDSSVVSNRRETALEETADKPMKAWLLIITEVHMIGGHHLYMAVRAESEEKMREIVVGYLRTNYGPEYDWETFANDGEMCTAVSPLTTDFFNIEPNSYCIFYNEEV